MSTNALTQQPAQTVQVKSEIEYKPFGSDDAIKLSLSIVKNYVAVPTKEGELPDDRDAMRFMMLCRSQRLNPFAGDAYLIGYKKHGEPKATWSLITAHAAFLKRAELHPEYDGIESGVIVLDANGQLVEREGDFTHDGDKLQGAWANVFFKHRSHPMKKKVKLSSYQKPFGVWVTDAAGMCCKVAESQALRDSFPTLLGGMIMREEIIDVPAEVTTRSAKRPDFARGLPSPEITGRPKEKTSAPEAPEPTNDTEREPDHLSGSGPEDETPKGEGQTGASEPRVAPATASPSATTPSDDHAEALNNVRFLLNKSNKTEDQLMALLRSKKSARDDQKLQHLSATKLQNIGKAWESLAKEMA